MMFLPDDVLAADCCHRIKGPPGTFLGGETMRCLVRPLRCSFLFSILVELLLADKLGVLRSRADMWGLIDGHGSSLLFLCKLFKRVEA